MKTVLKVFIAFVWFFATIEAKLGDLLDGVDVQFGENCQVPFSNSPAFPFTTLKPDQTGLCVEWPFGAASLSGATCLNGGGYPVLFYPTFGLVSCCAQCLIDAKQETLEAKGCEVVNGSADSCPGFGVAIILVPGPMNDPSGRTLCCPFED